MENYHARYLTHLSKFTTKTASNTILNISRKIYACPPANSHPINHFLYHSRVKDKMISIKQLTENFGAKTSIANSSRFLINRTEVQYEIFKYEAFFILTSFPIFFFFLILVRNMHCHHIMVVMIISNRAVAFVDESSSIASFSLFPGCSCRVLYHNVF